MVDREALLARVDVGQVIEADLGPPVRRSGRWLFWRCPFHAGGQERTPSLGATPDDGRWKCFGCGEIGNSIDWVMRQENVGFVEACRRLGASQERGQGDVRKRESVREMATRSVPLPEAWQERALEFVYECQARLWREGPGALAYLRGRGLVDETIWEWGLGFQAEDAFEEPSAWGMDGQGGERRRKAVWLPRGITLPCWDRDQEVLHYVKVRRSSRDISKQYPMKYAKLAIPEGCSGMGLYGEHAMRGREVLFLDEGEFNALTVWQEAGDLLDAASTGTASIRPETLRPYWDYIVMAHLVLTRFDVDAAGGRAGEQWRALSKRVRTVQVPEGDDPNDFLQQNGNVRAWVELEMAKAGAGR